MLEGNRAMWRSVTEWKVSDKRKKKKAEENKHSDKTSGKKSK